MTIERGKVNSSVCVSVWETWAMCEFKIKTKTKNGQWTLCCVIFVVAVQHNHSEMTAKILWTPIFPVYKIQTIDTAKKTMNTVGSCSHRSLLWNKYGKLWRRNGIFEMRKNATVMTMTMTTTTTKTFRSREIAWIHVIIMVRPLSSININTFNWHLFIMPNQNNDWKIWINLQLRRSIQNWPFCFSPNRHTVWSSFLLSFLSRSTFGSESKKKSNCVFN